MLLFFAGFLLSLFGSLPPGLISLSVSQTSITRGLTAALALAAGAALAEFFQAWVAVLLTDWFLSHPMAERGFHWAAFPVFLFLGVYLFFFAKAPNPKAPRMPSNLGRQFMKGTIVSLFNLMAIPYWFVYCGSLKVEGYWQEGLIYTLIFAFGVSIGTFGALALYAWLGQLVLNHTNNLAKFANRLIGLIFIGLGLRILWGLLS